MPLSHGCCTVISVQPRSRSCRTSRSAPSAPSRVSRSSDQATSTVSNSPRCARRQELHRSRSCTRRRPCRRSMRRRQARTGGPRCICGGSRTGRLLPASGEDAALTGRASTPKRRDAVRLVDAARAAPPHPGTQPTIGPPGAIGNRLMTRPAAVPCAVARSGWSFTGSPREGSQPARRPGPGPLRPAPPRTGPDCRCSRACSPPGWLRSAGRFISSRQRAVGGLDRGGKGGGARQVAVDGSRRAAALGERPHDQ